MTPILELLADKELPGWLLIKNAIISQGDGMGHRITSFESHFWSNDYEEISSMIPKPKLLNTREAKELASYRYTDEEIAEEQFAFDDLPNSLMNEGSDMDLFGESWTLFWVVPPDHQEVINIVSSHLKAGAQEKITSEQISACWKSMIDRMFFRHADDLSTLDLLELHQQVNDELIPAINALDVAPDEEAWEVLNEDVFWDDDDY